MTENDALVDMLSAAPVNKVRRHNEYEITARPLAFYDEDDRQIDRRRLALVEITIQWAMPNDFRPEEEARIFDEMLKMVEFTMEGAAFWFGLADLQQRPESLVACLAEVFEDQWEILGDADPRPIPVAFKPTLTNVVVRQELVAAALQASTSVKP